MKTPNLKSDLISIAEKIPDSATYADAMYQLYVRMKIAQGKLAAEQGNVVPHDQVEQKFIQK
ncbi:MAG: hypothetical protein JXD22_02395 [Sedimentisphaerales bacterium]|nr:hypothetical protein [Sedimentisphaerales bacterium]